MKTVAVAMGLVAGLAGVSNGQTTSTTADPAAMCPLMGQTPSSMSWTGSDSTAKPNYAIRLLSGNLFAYALNQCTSMDILESVYGIFACNADKSKMTLQQYDGADCGTTTGDLEEWSLSDQGVTQGSGQEYDFYCDGDSAFAVVNFAVDTECSAAATKTAYAAVNVCFNPDSSDPAQASMTVCTDTTVELLGFGDIQDGDTTSADCSIYCATQPGTDTCGPLLTTLSPPIYGSIEACCYPGHRSQSDLCLDFGETPTTTEDEDSANSLFSLSAILVSALATLAMRLF